MANTLDTRTIFNGRRYKVIRLQCKGDGTPADESAATKMDISTFTDPTGQVATYTAIDRIVFSVSGITTVQMFWDHTTDDEIATFGAGQGVLDWSQTGGLVDPRTTGGTGDILLTTSGMAAQGGYDITMYVRCKA